MSESVICQFGPKEASLFGCHNLALRHRLHEHDLFSDNGLAELIERIPSKKYNLHSMSAVDEPQVFWRRGELGGVSGLDVISAIRAGRLWLNLRAVQDIHPGYRELLDDLFQTFETNVPGLRTFRRSLGILISSPGAQVFYHADEPGQGLWQIRGHKRIYLYPNTPPFLNQSDMEGIVIGESEEDLPYKPWFEEFADVYDLEPGDGLIWPLNAPHRVINADELNVSVTTAHWTKEIRRSRAVHFANGILRRRLGWKHPTYSTRGLGVLPKAAFSFACGRLGLYRRSRADLEITFKLDRTSPSQTVDLAAIDKG